MKKVTGTINATGATLNVPIGFKPDVVRVVNVMSRNAINFQAVDASVNPNGITDPADGGLRAKAVSAAVGIAHYDGTEGVESEGFTVGATAVVNVNGNVLAYEAEQCD